MNFIQEVNLIEITGWTLLHSVWQGAVVAVALFIALRVMKKATANARYLTACLALFLFAALPAAIFVRLAANEAAANKIHSSLLNVKGNSSSENSLPRQPRNYLEDTANSGEFTQKSENEITGFRLDFANLEKNAASLLPYLVWLWFLGLSVQAAQLFGKMRRVRELQSQDDSPIPSEWLKKAVRLRDELKIKRAVKFLTSSTASGAFTIGWLKPVIIIPASALLHLAPHELETILRHELAHVRRHDYIVNLLQSLVEAVFFYHPAVWWISTVIRREREFACDDFVIQSGNNKIAYARALANLEQIRLTANDETRLKLAAGGGENLLDRIKRIVESNDNRHCSRFSAFATGLSLLIVAAILVNSWAASLQPPAASPADNLRVKKIAVGFVSLPPVDRTEIPPQDSSATARVLIEKLKTHRVPAIGFVLGAVISDGENLSTSRADIVRLWRDAGFEIGIGNFRHVWFYDTPFEEYAAGVEKNERIVKQLLAEKNLPLRYFSYPFLNTGRTAEDKKRFEGWLKERGLKTVAYTIDNQEWMYSYAYDAALKDNNAEKMKVIRAQFLDYMSKMFDHFEAYSQEMFGRDINQTMVLTPSRLIADTADDLFGMIEKRGYQFVSIDEAQADEAYQTPDAFGGNKSGISWFERWAITEGRRLRDEPRVSRNVWDIWNRAKDKK